MIQGTVANHVCSLRLFFVRVFILSLVRSFFSSGEHDAIQRQGEAAIDGADQHNDRVQHHLPPGEEPGWTIHLCLRPVSYTVIRTGPL